MVTKLSLNSEKTKTAKESRFDNCIERLEILDDINKFNDLNDLGYS